MKTVLLVSKQRSVQQMYYQQLDDIFRGYLTIRPCAPAEESEDLPADSGIEQADIILITNPYSFPYARRQTRPDASIINLEFSFAKDRVEALKQFPVGTETLACFNWYSSAHQAVTTLYAAGVSNLNLYIHYPGNQNLTDKTIDLAVISGATREIPPGIPQVFDLGERKVSLTTLLDIAVKAGVLDDELIDRIGQYAEGIASPDNYLSHFYDTSAATTIQLKSIMECIDYGIVIYDDTGKIIHFNNSFHRLLDLPRNLYGRHLQELPLEAELSRLISLPDTFSNQLYTMNGQGRSLSVSKEKINKSDHSTDLFILLLKDITEITNMESSLRKQIAKRGHVTRYTFEDIKGSSPAMAACVKKARRIATIDKPTLILGESGTGKELFAQSIHSASDRAHFPFVAMNCAAIPATLLESELFGYHEGAFTGARRGGKEGLFQMAQKGTLFLDEIGELSLPTQAKLLRALEEKEIMKVGSGELIEVDVRIIAATNRDLNALVDSGRFRLDLYYRLNTLIINVPPLRQRQGDVWELAQEFLRREAPDGVFFTRPIQDFLMRYEWKGNVRELRNCIEYMAHISDGPITPEHLPDYLLDAFGTAPLTTTPQWGPPPLSDTERKETLSLLSLLHRRPMGRRALLDAMECSGTPVSEYRLRALLHTLQENGCINFGRGRAGCALTGAGVAMLESLSAQP